MAFSTETVGRLWASARGYSQFSIGFLSSIGLVSAAQSKGLLEGLADVYAGIAQTVQGLTSIWQIGLVVAGPITSVVLARMASNSAKVSNQASAVRAAVLDPNTPIPPDVKRDIVAAAKGV